MITDARDILNALATVFATNISKATGHSDISVDIVLSAINPCLGWIMDKTAEKEASYEDVIAKLRQEIDCLKKENNDKAKEIQCLRAKLAELNASADTPKVEATSENSSLPPSKDKIGFKRTRSLRKKSNRPSGGQPNHKGHYREQSETPDRVVECAPTICPKCGKPLDREGMQVIERRQICDIPPVVLPYITEYALLEGRCSCGHCCQGTFPEGVVAPFAYGPNIHGFVSYMSAHHSIPLGRMTDIMDKIYSVKMSQGTVTNILGRMGKKGSVNMEEYQHLIEQSDVVGADETGLKIDGKLFWMWVFQTALISYMFIDKRRGKDVINEHFPNGLPKTILVTDRLIAYFSFICKGHQICLAHLLRNLVYLGEITPESDWADNMISLIQRAIHYNKQQSENIDENEVAKFQKELDTLLNDIPILENEKQQKEIEKFILGLTKKKEYILTFLKEKDVPPDNNASERAIRPVKTKMKVSGQFKSLKGAENYATLKSIIQTAIKQGYDPLNALRNLAMS